MQKLKIETPELRILQKLNDITGSKFRPIKSNLTKISALLKAGFTEQDFIEVIQLKTLQWKNNPTMSGYLCPGTLFRESNFEKYVNEVNQVKQNPKLYAKHLAEINGVKPASAADDHDAISDLYG